MYHPLRETQDYKEQTDVFMGYYHNLKCRNGEFYDMKNMAGDNYPVLSPRRKRGVYRQVDNPQGLIAKSALVYIDGTKAVVDGAEIEMGLSTATEDCPKDLVGMGAYVIIMPDKKYINTIDLSDRGDIDAHGETTGTVTFTPVNILGEEYANAVVSTTAPDAPKEGDVWIDSGEHIVKKWSVTEWLVIPETYIKISCPGIGTGFKEGDGIRISGVTDPGIRDLNASSVIQAWNADWIVVKGLSEGEITQDGVVTLDRKMPKVDYVTESNNRLWACRYGTANDGQVVNEIYASKLGDFKNWECYDGISTDSYTVSIGSDGPFTGAVTQRNCPVFYKEACKHKILGGTPASFRVISVNCEGVGLGNHRSIAIVNEYVYFLSPNNVCRDDGGQPVIISKAFGTEHYRDAVGGAAGNKYFLSARGADDQYHAFVFDASRGFWHREDDTRAMAIESYRNDVYYIDAERKAIMTMKGTGIEEKEPVSWFVETGLLAADSPEQKYISRVNIRLELGVGSRVRIMVRYDSTGQWEHIGNISTTPLRSFWLPVRLRRCDHFQLRIEGEGDVKIYNLIKVIEEAY